MGKLTALGHDPMDDSEGILREQFYGKRALAPAPMPPPPGRAAAKPKPTHYRIVCISLYTEDIARLEAMVAELKRRGHTKASKSAVIRFALDTADIGKMPKGY